ncbi:MAG: sugar transferase [Chloroflexi bacterium]|nr:MAG: sugar transferase [Chloroflexota bacterium]RLC81086.1 MAG: sugar transferase [Chloroflexota bacterium]
MELVIVNRPQVLLPYRRIHQIAKRVMDWVLCVLALPFALPLMGLCALLIRLDSPGPALFIQERIGKGGRRFRMYKFRTMQHNLDDGFHRAFMKAFVNGQIGNAGENGKQGTNGNLHGAFKSAFVSSKVNNNGKNGNGKVYKPIQTSQVTRAGHILRKTSLDELPQIINVLKGEMSLVGPRPNVPWEVEEYKPWHHERLEVLPGITGLAQVRGRSGISFDTIVQYDIEYVEQQSLALDWKILWWTVSSVIIGAGAE